MTARFLGQQWTELDSRDLTSFLIRTRVDTDQVQLWFILFCGTILCQLQKAGSYQGLLELKKPSSCLQLCIMPGDERVVLTDERSHTDARPPRSSPVRNPEREARLWTSTRLSQEVPLEVLHTMTDCQAVRRKRLSCVTWNFHPAWKTERKFCILQLPGRLDVELGPPLPPGSDES